MHLAPLIGPWCISDVERCCPNFGIANSSFRPHPALLTMQAKSTFGSDRIFTAHDFFTAHVPVPQPPAFTNMALVLEWAAAAEMARIALPHLTAASMLVAS